MGDKERADFLENRVDVHQVIRKCFWIHTLLLVCHVVVENGNSKFVTGIEGCEHVEERTPGDSAWIRGNALRRSVDAVVDVLDIGELEGLSSENGVHDLDKVAFAEKRAVDGEDVGGELWKEDISETRENAQRKELSAVDHRRLEKTGVVGDGENHAEAVFHQTLCVLDRTGRGDSRAQPLQIGIKADKKLRVVGTDSIHDSGAGFRLDIECHDEEGAEDVDDLAGMNDAVLSKAGRESPPNVSSRLVQNDTERRKQCHLVHVVVPHQERSQLLEKTFALRTEEGERGEWEEVVHDLHVAEKPFVRRQAFRPSLYTAERRSHPESLPFAIREEPEAQTPACCTRCARCEWPRPCGMRREPTAKTAPAKSKDVESLRVVGCGSRIRRESRPERWRRSCAPFPHTPGWMEP